VCLRVGPTGLVSDETGVLWLPWALCARSACLARVVKHNAVAGTIPTLRSRVNCTWRWYNRNSSRSS